jgi:N-methylhydantoinase A
VAVGPDSAGAEPGPAAYGRGGKKPTTTDTALLAGILSPGGFLGGKMALHPRLSKAAFEALDTPMSLDELVRQAWAVALNNIAEGIFNISIRRGIDPRDFSLMAYGAAGPMMLPAVLDMLGMKRVIVPPYPGLFSALGLVSSDLVFMDQRSAYLPLDNNSAGKIDAIFADMERSLGRRALRGKNVNIKRSFDAQLMGQASLTPLVPAPDGRIDGGAVSRMNSAFHDVYGQRNGNRFEQHGVEAVTYRVQATQSLQKVSYPTLERRPAGNKLAAIGIEPIKFVYGASVDAYVYNRADLRCGDTIQGPAIVREAMSTTLVPPGRNLTVGRYAELIVS